MGEKGKNGSVGAFNSDVSANKGYIYTTNAGLSSRLANRRLTDAVLAMCSLRGRRVLDVGCGDGAYTMELFDIGRPASMAGVDAASGAIAAARERDGGRGIKFEVCGAHSLPFADDSFDIAHMRGLLHHLDDPQKVIAEAFRVAPEIVIVEPNGYNPVLKVIEKVSRYHREHGERSYPPFRLRRWIRSAGGEVISSVYAGLVPFFCPAPAARVLKAAEPLVEALPLVRELSCAVQVIRARRTGGSC